MPRNNTPRIGRVLIARGRDACDVALSSTFGPNTLERFKVWTDVVDATVAGAMTYCVGVKLEEGLILASDSRTHAGVDNYAKFCKMTVFERAGDRVLVLLSSGGLAGTQAVINVLRQRAAAEAPNLWIGGLDVRRGQPGVGRDARHRAPRRAVPGRAAA